MVIAFHYFPEIYFLKFGWTGVDLFFVLSGFLISSRLIPYINNRDILLQFYRNRLLRIIPLYFAFLILFFLSWFFIVSKHTIVENPFYTKYWFAFFFFFQNWAYIFFPGVPIDALNHFWSLALEEQFYLLFPFFVLLIRKPKRIILTAGLLTVIVLISRIIYFTPHTNYQSIYWNTFFRSDSFLIGCIVFILFNYFSKKQIYFKIFKFLSITSFMLVLSGAFYYKSLLMSNPSFQTFGYTCISIMFGFILFQILEKSNKYLTSLLSNEALQYCGKISYGLYIFHWPIYLTGFGMLNKLLKNQDFSLSTIHYFNVFYSIIITFSISHLSYKYFESHFLKMKYRNQNIKKYYGKF